MHHTLKWYSKRRRGTLRFYMLFARWTRIPLLGRLVRWIANSYGVNLHGAYLLTPAEAEELLDIAEGVAVAACTCRQVFGNCDNPIDVEIILGPTRHVLLEAMPHDSHEITREEAREMAGLNSDVNNKSEVYTLSKSKRETKLTDTVG